MYVSSCYSKIEKGTVRAKALLCMSGSKIGFPFCGKLKEH